MSVIPSCREQQCEQHEPYDQQVVPVDRAQLDAVARFDQLVLALAHSHERARPYEQAAEQMQCMHGGQQIKEGERRIAWAEKSGSFELLPREKLPAQEGER